MKKRLFLIAAAALALVACAKEEAYEPEVVVSHKGVKVTIGASFEDLTNGTKSDYTAGGDFYWSTGDAIWIGSDMASGNTNWGYGYIITDQTNKGPGYAIADFNCILTGGTTTAVAAVFPFESVTPSYTAGSPLGTLSLTLKNTISWANSSGLSDDLKKEIYDRNKGLETTDPKYVSDIKFMQADNVMVARYEDIYTGGYPQGTTTGLQFYNVGGVFCLTLNNIPPGAEKLVFTTDKKITGTFPVSNVVSQSDSKNYPQIATTTAETEAEKSVTIEFETITSSLNTRVFFIPVPVGSYVIGFDTQDHDGNSLWKFSAARANTVERGHIVKMPALTHVVVSGGGDSATNIITTPTGCNETVYLPSTESNIYVRMNQTGGTITLAYSTIEGAKHPANVYLEALGDIENLNINLPDSHVELKGSGSVAQVITNVTSYTSYATLKVANTVKIGKDEAENSGLTVTGGSLDLEAPVEGKVKVDIPETVLNTTEEKVSINIASSIKKLDVKRAANQEAANKIYVTIAQAAKVKDSLAVPETNCNLYVANGAEVKVVETKATENTVEGKVETLAASGKSTVVTVTKAGSVTESITSAAQATVVIENRTNQEVLDGKAGEIVEVTAGETTQGGTITMIDGTVVAYIGSTPYTSLQSAIDAAEAGNTVKLAKDYDAATKEAMSGGTRQFVIKKSITIDGNGYSVTTRDRGFGVGNVNGDISSYIDVTFKNITILNSTAGARCIDTRGYIGSLTLDGVKLSTEGATSGYTQPLTIGGDQAAPATVTITNSTIQTNDEAIAYYAIITFNPVNMTISNSTIQGWACIYAKGVNSSAGSAGSTINIDKSTMTSRNIYNGVSNAFSAIVFEDNNINVNITNSTINIHGESDQLQTLASFGDDSAYCTNDIVTLGEGNTVNLSGNSALAMNIGETSGSDMIITGGTFTIDPSAYVADGYQAVKSGNLWTVSKVAGVAAIGSTGYPTLAAAVEEVTNGQTITLLSDVTYDDGILYNKEGVSAKLNLNGKTLTVNTGSNANNRAIRIDNGTLEVYGGSIFAVGSGTNSSNGAGCYGAFRVEGNGVLNAHDLTLTNSRPWGLNVKVVGGVATLTNVTINSSYGGGIEVTETELGGHSKTGSATLTNCTFTQTGYFDHCSTTLSVSGGSALTINSGSYTSDNYAMYVFSSGGVITVNGGTFSGSYGNNDVAIIAAIDTNTYPEYTGGLQINGGTVTGGFAITSPAYMSITGGTYDHNPSAYVADGYAAVDNGDGTWTVSEVNYVAQIESAKYETLAEAIAAVPENEQTTITMISNTMLENGVTIAANKNVVLELNGKTIAASISVANHSALITNNGTLKIQDNTDSNANGTGLGKITYFNSDPDPKDTPSYFSNTIVNQGDLTIDSGYIENTTYTGYAAYTVDNLTNGGLYTPVFTMNGGKLFNSHTDAIRMFLNSTSKLNKVVIKGGIIDSDKEGRIVVIQNANSSLNKGEFDMTGGVVTKGVGGWSSIEPDYYYSDEQYGKVSINITGGQMHEFITTYFPKTAARANALHVTGGTFEVDPSDYVSAGYAATGTGNTWTVGQAKNCKVYTPSVTPDLENQKINFTEADVSDALTFAQAVAAATSGKVIELIGDVDVRGLGTINVPAGVTIDFAGHTIKADRLNGNGGKFIFKQSDQRRYEQMLSDYNFTSWEQVKTAVASMSEDVFSYVGELGSNVEIHGGTFTADYRSLTPSEIGEYAQFANGYFFPSLPEARVYHATAEVLTEKGISFEPSVLDVTKENDSYSVKFGSELPITSFTVPNGAYVFQCMDENDESPITRLAYGNWNTDYVVYTDKPVATWTYDNATMPTIVLWGAYDIMQFAPAFLFDMGANEKLPLLNSVTQGWFNYNKIRDMVNTFICGTVNLQDLNGTTLNVELCIAPKDSLSDGYITLEKYQYAYGDKLF